MKFAIRLLGVASGAAILASCGGGKMADTGGLPAASQLPATTGVADLPVKIGSPYSIGNVSYTPEDVAAYDDVGYASYYGNELAGNKTANGEMFAPTGITAAHKTLPLPSYVEVTALDTGRTILVRINDRGPFANDRLIDLSEGAARQLGINSQGVAGVRVRKVNPPEQERAALRSGRQVAERISTPESLLRVLNMKLAKQPKPSGAAQLAVAAPSRTPVANSAPVASSSAPRANNAPGGRFIREGAQAPANTSRPMPAARPKPPKDGRFIREGEGTSAAASAPQAAAAGYVVQLASYSNRGRADQLARSLGASVQASSDGALYRVRFGPYATEAEAQRGLATAQQRGYPQARIFRE